MATCFSSRSVWRPELWSTVLALMGGCSPQPADEEPETVEEQAGKGSAPASAQAERGDACPEIPTAHVLQHPEAAQIEALLIRAGFAVANLQLDSSPRQLEGMILLGAHASEHAAYAQYMEAYAEDLYHFVDKANLLVQLTQAHDVEVSPPFLPTTHGAQRGQSGFDQAHVRAPESPLMAGVATSGGALAWQAANLGSNAFSSQAGFEVILSGEPDGAEPLLLNGAYGQGRIVLAGLNLDYARAPGGPDEHRPFEAGTDAAEFWDGLLANLRQHTVDVCRRSTSALELAASPLNDAFQPGSFVFAVLPDTQVYSLRYPGIFSAQTNFLAQNRDRLDIRYVFHLGDIVNNNTPLEWEHARDAMALLRGKLSYAMVPGNHDYGPSGDASTRDTLLNEYFDFDTAQAEPDFGGAFEQGKLDNTYHFVSAGGRDYIVLALEWGPRDAVLDWANEVMNEHGDYYGILVTHAYLNSNDRLYDHTDTDYPQDYNPHEYSTPGGVNDGREIWEKLVRHHRFVMTLNGHVLGDGAGYLVGRTDRGTTCHQMLINFQMRKLGGEGYLRFLEFLPNRTTVRVSAYSPLYDEFLQEPEQEFSFELDPL